jgi:hypothetical protein
MLDHVLGKAAKLVKVKYNDRWMEDGRLKTQIVEGYLGLTNCGEVRFGILVEVTSERSFDTQCRLLARLSHAGPI